MCIAQGIHLFYINDNLDIGHLGCLQFLSIIKQVYSILLCVLCVYIRPYFLRIKSLGHKIGVSKGMYISKVFNSIFK